MRNLERAQTRYEVDLANWRGDLTNSLSTRWGYLLTFRVGNGQKNFSASEMFFLTHSNILLWPHSTWLRVRVAQCAMRVMVQSHLGWPWECHRSPDTSFGTILDQYALQDGWHLSCYRLLRHSLPRMAGHDAIHLAKHTHPEWCKRGY